MNSFENTCRICLSCNVQNVKYVNIYYNQLYDDERAPSEGVSLAKALTELTKIECYEGDGFPEFLCSICEYRLIDAYYLWLQAIETNLKMTQMANKHMYQELPLNNGDYEDVTEILGSTDVPNGFDLTTHSADEDGPVTSKAKPKGAKRGKYNKQGVASTERKKARLERKHVCNVCNRAYYHAIYLEGHMLTHDPKPNLCCKYCTKIFGQLNNLQGHLRNHANGKQYPCNMCSLTFTSAQGLDDHRRTHTGSPMFQCEYCPKRFKGSKTLRTHVHNKHA